MEEKFAAHATNLFKLMWWVLLFVAWYGGVTFWEFGPFLVTWAGILHAIDVTWWLQGWKLTRAAQQQQESDEGVHEDELALESISPEETDMFDRWGNRSLIQDMDAKLSSSVAYDSYAAACRMNRIVPKSSTKFYRWLTERAEQNAPAVKKEKTNGGRIFYKGWRLVGSEG